MELLFKRRWWLVTSLLVVSIAASVGIWGCSNSENPVAANDTREDATILFSKQNPAVQSVMAVQNRHTKNLMADQDVIGTATTVGDDGRLAIMVMATSQRAMNAVPDAIEGVPVKAVLTDRIVAMKGKPGGGGGGKKSITRPSRPRRFSSVPRVVGDTTWPTATAAAGPSAL